MNSRPSLGSPRKTRLGTKTVTPLLCLAQPVWGTKVPQNPSIPSNLCWGILDSSVSENGHNRAKTYSCPIYFSGRPWTHGSLRNTGPRQGAQPPALRAGLQEPHLKPHQREGALVLGTLRTWCPSWHEHGVWSLADLFEALHQHLNGIWF